MAKRKSLKFNSFQPSLFDDMPGEDSLRQPMEAIPVHPSITDFVVNVRKQEARRREEPDDITMASDSLHPIDSIVFMSFGSGSSGNCAYIGDSSGGFLVDAGVDVKRVQEGLEANGLSMRHVKGICLTHDHSDHVRYVYGLVRKHTHIAVYCTPKAFGGIMRRHSISRRLKDYHHPIYKEFPFKIGAFEITAFDVCHDGTDNSGFFISHGSHRFAVATDLGSITPRVEHYMSQANYVMLESNYDAEMLMLGKYPPHLKARIAAENGHLDNRVAAEFLAGHYSPSMRYVFLCHLSQDNNTPELALSTVNRALLDAGVSGIGGGTGSMADLREPLQLVALPRYDRSPLYTLRID